jgi:hypothetical protein
VATTERRCSELPVAQVREKSPIREECFRSSLRAKSVQGLSIDDDRRAQKEISIARGDFAGVSESR